MQINLNNNIDVAQKIKFLRQKWFDCGICNFIMFFEYAWIFLLFYWFYLTAVKTFVWIDSSSTSWTLPPIKCWNDVPESNLAMCKLCSFLHDYFSFTLTKLQERRLHKIKSTWKTINFLPQNCTNTDCDVCNIFCFQNKASDGTDVFSIQILSNRCYIPLTSPIFFSLARTDCQMSAWNVIMCICHHTYHIFVYVSIELCELLLASFHQIDV